jgi:hypothetical protein
MTDSNSPTIFRMDSYLRVTLILAALMGAGFLALPLSQFGVNGFSFGLVALWGGCFVPLLASTRSRVEVWTDVVRAVGIFKTTTIPLREVTNVALSGPQNVLCMTTETHGTVRVYGIQARLVLKDQETVAVVDEIAREVGRRQRALVA